VGKTKMTAEESTDSGGGLFVFLLIQVNIMEDVFFF
jgi:hypothetical protein